MGRSSASTRTNAFDYEVRSAEPRTSSSSTTYTRQPASNVYTQPQPRSYEDVSYEASSRGMPRKSTSYESERKRSSLREEERERERRRYEEDERARQKMERKAEKLVHGDKKKSRDKERRRGTEEKTRTRATNAYVESSEDEYIQLPRGFEKKTSKHRMEEEIRMREEAARAEAAMRQEQAARAQRSTRERERERERERSSIKPVELAPKWDGHHKFADQYIGASKRRVESSPIEHPGMRRAETFAASPSQKYNIRYESAAQHLSDEDDSPRRSSARKQETRRASEAPISRPEVSSREKANKSSRRSPPHAQDPYIVEPPSPPPMAARMPPPLQTHSSAPPNLSSTSRKEPTRSKTQDYPRAERTPPLPRAATFAPGDRGRPSKLRQQMNSSESDSDGPMYASPRYSHSPPPQPRKTAEPTTRYVIEKGRSVPIKTRTADPRSDLNDNHRDRSESPRASSRHPQERPSTTRQSSERPRATPTRSQSQAYYPPTAPSAEPIILTARPKLARENSHSNVRSSSRSGGGGSGGSGGVYFGEVKYMPQYGPENVIYTTHPPAGGDSYRRGAEGVHVVHGGSHGHHSSGGGGSHRDYNYPTTSRGGRQQVYT